MTLRTLWRLACLVCATAVLAGCVLYGTAPEGPTPRPAVNVEIGFFHDALDPDGD